MELDIKCANEKGASSANEMWRDVVPAPVFPPPVEMRVYVAALHAQLQVRLMNEREGRSGTNH